MAFALTLTVPGVYQRAGRVRQAFPVAGQLRPGKPWDRLTKFGVLLFWPRSLGWLTVTAAARPDGGPDAPFADAPAGLDAVCAAHAVPRDQVAPPKFLDANRYLAAALPAANRVVVTIDLDTDHPDFAAACWQRRHRFVARLTSIPDALVQLAASPVPLAFADVADNPGGGGSGNTMEILRAFHAVGVERAAFGCIIDPALAAEAHALGVGAAFTARFNRTGADGFEAPSIVRALSDGQVTGRRGLYGGVAMRLGATAWLQLGGIAVVVISERAQCADPAFFEHLGIDLAAMRAVVVKSRGHFRAGFDEFFPHDAVVEVDGPGLTSPIFSRFDWKHLPRPILPLDAEAVWP